MDNTPSEKDLLPDVIWAYETSGSMQRRWLYSEVKPNTHYTNITKYTRADLCADSAETISLRERVKELEKIVTPNALRQHELEKQAEALAGALGTLKLRLARITSVISNPPGALIGTEDLVDNALTNWNAYKGGK